MDLGALHPISGRQWELTDDQSKPIWPDSCIVVPFASRVADGTGKIVKGEVVDGKSDQGRWTVTSTLRALELTDLVQGQPVAGVTAVWAAGPGGDTPALHVLGSDPFSWLTPHLDAAATAWTTTYPIRDQWFGAGPFHAFKDPRRFGEVVIDPASFGMLLSPPVGWLTNRVLLAPDATLSFSYPSGDPILVDNVWLGVLSGIEEPIEGDFEEIQFITLDDSVWSLLGGGKPSSSDWHLALVKVHLDQEAVDLVEIPYDGSILFVRYHRQQSKVTTPEKITLKPGHYELILKGDTKAVTPTSDLEGAEVTWNETRRFWVELPRSLRPYVRFATFGDDRLFGTRPGFDPTLPGLGFPFHTDYLPVVRFSVPYVQEMFEYLRLRVSYIDPKQDVTDDVKVEGNKAKESTLPESAQAWKMAHGGSVPPDDEVVMKKQLSLAGSATLHLSHIPPVGEEFQLDSWGVYISSFPNAASHLDWPGTCITRFYRPDGPHDQPPCPTVGSPKGQKIVKDPYQGTRRASDLHFAVPGRMKTMSKETDFSESPPGSLLMPITWVFTVMPEEYTKPPDDWPLPTALATLLEDTLDAAAAQRFLLFLWRSKVRLTKTPAPEPALAGVGDAPGSNTIEAVCDPQNRPLALWLRTPEPIDWRRVHAEMTLRHVEPDTSCPTSYANRHTMTLSVQFLPSTDGSGVLLVARLDGIATRLPRGEITLNLTYELSEPGLVKLRPGTSLPSDHETLSMTFLQPLGQTWPVKPAGPLGRVMPPKKLVPKPKYGPPQPGPYRTQTLRRLIQKLYGKELPGP